jgi:hypothetical protein
MKMENTADKRTLKEKIMYWFKITMRSRISRTQVKIKKRRFKNRKNKLESTSTNLDINNMQKKAIDLFLALLKHKSSYLNHSPESKVRFIETDFLWLTMSSATDRSYLINIIDQSEEDAHSHEVYIPTDYAYALMDEFDLELEKRFRAIEAAKKRIVVDDIDKLIEKIKPFENTVESVAEESEIKVKKLVNG